MRDAHRDLGHECEGAAGVQARPAAQGRGGHGLGLEHRRPQQLQDREQSQDFVIFSVNQSEPLQVVAFKTKTKRCALYAQ